MIIGKCPACGGHISGDEIEERKFRGTLHTHHAYVCARCGTIIGFSAARP